MKKFKEFFEQFDIGDFVILGAIILMVVIFIVITIGTNTFKEFNQTLYEEAPFIPYEANDDYVVIHVANNDLEIEEVMINKNEIISVSKLYDNEEIGTKITCDSSVVYFALESYESILEILSL